MEQVSLTDAAMCMNLINEPLFNIVISYVILVVLIFHCANTTAFHMPNWKFLKGVVRLNWVAKWVAA